MVNVGFSFASLLGILFAVGGAGLYFLRQFRPNLARDYDVFFAAVGLSTGIILFFFGWQLEPVHQINTLLLTCTIFFFAYESIRLRGVTVEQAKRRTPVIDDERPVSRVYRAELDDWEEMNDRARRRIPSSRDRYREEEDYYGDRYPQRPPYEEARRPAGRLKPSDDYYRRRPPVDEQSGRPLPPDTGWEGDDARRPPRRSPEDAQRPRPSSERGSRRDRTDRTLNVKPYSERPNGPTEGGGAGGEGGYVDFRPVNPPDNPSPERPNGGY